MTAAPRTLLATALLTLSACASTGNIGPTIQIFDEDLRQVFENFDRTMSEPRSPLALRSGGNISTCHDYLQHSARVDRAEPAQMVALQEYVVCDSVALLQRALPVPETRIDAGAAIATRLDFRTFPSSRGPRTSDDAFSFQTLVDAPLAIETNAAMLDSDEWYLRIERVAAADFDGNGQEDWLLWVSDDSHVGTYQTFHALLIQNVTATGPLVGTSVPCQVGKDGACENGLLKSLRDE